jgi:hypothetical protein
MADARGSVLRVISGLLTRQSFVLSLQDAFLVTLGVTGLAIIATWFVRSSRKPAQINEPSLSLVNPSENPETEAAQAETLFAG